MFLQMSGIRTLQLYSFRSYHLFNTTFQNEDLFKIVTRFKVILRVYLSKIITLKRIKLQSSNNTHQKECFNTFPTVIWFLHLHDSNGEIIQNILLNFFFAIVTITPSSKATEIFLTYMACGVICFVTNPFPVGKLAAILFGTKIDTQINFKKVATIFPMMQFFLFL